MVSKVAAGYSYYKENPSLMVWKIVEQILTDCGLM